jgi:transcriptional regulator with XRE-family HTH domain
LKPEQKVARDLAARIRHLRHGRELSQEALAEAAGIHRTYLGGIETGRRNPSLKNLWRIAHALGIPLSRLFEGVG